MGINRYMEESSYGNCNKKNKCAKINLSCKNRGYRCNYTIEECEYIENSCLELNDLECNTSTYRADCMLNKVRYLKIYGYVRTENGQVGGDVLVSLLKQVLCNNQLQYENKGDAITDGVGYFQFVIYRDYDKDDYLIKLSEGNFFK
ncbi:MAG: hypothetical protein ACRCYE_00460 [Sarcina sp.]